MILKLPAKDLHSLTIYKLLNQRIDDMKWWMKVFVGILSSATIIAAIAALLDKIITIFG